jgi:hypothetical protein
MDQKQLQALPIYYRLEAREFMLGSVRSGLFGATARLSYTLTNDPHLIRGIRIVNTYDLPNDEGGPTEAQLALWMACREIDDDQALTLQIGQQNSVINGVHQRLVTGRRGDLWHNFAHPWPAAGGDTLSIELSRLVSYPVVIGTQPILPVAHVTLWCERLVDGDFAHQPPVRRVGR